MKKGETKEFKLSFPADYGRAELAGKEASFKVTIKEIKQEKLPAVDDDLAKQVNPEFKTVDDLKKDVIDKLQKNAEARAKRDYQQKVIDEVVKGAGIEYPAIMEEEEIDHLVQQQMQNWRTDEKGMEAYLQSIKKTPEQFREELRPIAIRNVKQGLALTEVAKVEDIKIDKEDMEKEIQEMTRDVAPERRDKLIEILNVPQTQVNIMSAIATRKTIDKLTEIAQSPAGAEKKIENAEAKPAAEQPKEANQ
jgi:trigger factor